MSRRFNIGFFIGLIFWSWELSAAWSSGGGGMFKDANNPWFVQNTDTVRYCIRIDSSQASLSEEQVDRVFRGAVAYWQREFSYTNFATADVVISTQTFVRQACPTTTAQPIDLVLQIGYLTAAQKAEIKSHASYASLVVRTDYDAVNLRARGFIYVAPEKSLSDIQGYELTENPWSGQNQVLLYWTLVHELGHVFGLQHTGQAPSPRNIMSYGFVEYILQKRNWPLLSSYIGSMAFFAIHPQPQNAPELICHTQLTQTARTLQMFFGIPPTWLCFGTILRDQSLEIWAAPDIHHSMNPTPIGTIFFEQERKEARPAMTFWTPREQRVLAIRQHPLLPSYIVRNIKGRYVQAQTGGQRWLGLVLDPTQNSPLLNDLRIITDFNGNSYMDLMKGF
ncbi:MAG TPA: matrixin family metalloprotease [Oligoflexus sp.]|uniref:matrixin family metalloprotease n=1 Tax=Oligoflexus sp. TaxID=1971216 RepID=UPI002D54481C|nr:matrixin family metalloprotease [Oligoflexus sp.]HYX37545.1 matrixin family metalloprotease [Oligoflexus sp.]